MAVKIRLMRIGAKARPFYRIVAVDERAKRTGGYLELLGTYNPLTEPKEIRIDQEKVDAWVKKGAQKSHGFLRIIGQAPQRPARKAKKDRGGDKEAAPEAPKSEDAPAEAASEEEVIETPAEETAPETANAADETPAEESSETTADAEATQPESSEAAEESEESK